MSERDRLPPGQIVTEKWPVLHTGEVPSVDLDRWSLRIEGLVETPYEITHRELLTLPRSTVRCDIHCVTRWSRFDNEFEGVSVNVLLDRGGILSNARFCLVHAEHGYTTNLPLADLRRPENLVAWRWNGHDLDPEHGYPARLLVPHLYFWKSAKWLRGFELLEDDVPGLWEDAGYHMRGDPWHEERFSRSDPARMRRGPRR
jgi:DMSO/TMAO reductase YedYZ molybdopterin-dependent catalytic subunit